MATSFLTYRAGRWLWISTVLAGAFILHYVNYQSHAVAYGGSLEGLMYGVLGMALIAVLMYLGIRKRSYTSGAGMLQGWVSAHVYLGMLTLLVIPLHAGFRFGWDVHTLAFALLAIVVLSGMIGVFLYRTIPERLTRYEASQQADKIDPEMARMLSDMRALVRDKSDALVQLYRAEVQRAQQSAQKGWSLLFKGQRNDLLATRSAELAKKVSTIPPADQATYQILSQLLLKKAQLEVSLLHQMRLRNALQAWLYIHIPVSIAMVCAVALHLILVFLY